MPAKLVVTATPKGSRIALLGSSGKQLLASTVFTEPRAKGATLRALRGILGEDVTVEDNTTVASLRRGGDAAPAATAPAPAATRPRRATKRRGTAKKAAKRVARRTTAATNGSEPTRAAAGPAKRARRRVPKS